MFLRIVRARSAEQFCNEYIKVGRVILPVVSQQVMIPVRVSGRGFLRLYSRKKVPASVLQVFFLHWKTITRYLVN